MKFAYPSRGKPTLAPQTRLALRPLIGAACLGLFSTALSAQEAEEITVLSPFEVSASSDSGYTATETLSGTRLRGLLKDTPVAVSVLTAEFLDDIGATDVESMAAFLPSTEVFTLVGAEDFGNSVKGGDVFTFRGFKSNSRLRNFFRSEAFGDRYLTDRITFARGPNALLFGIGNPGGSVQVSTNRAGFGPNKGSFEYRTDNYGSNRFSFDQNYVLIDDRVAVRADLLMDRSNGFRDPTRDNKDGVYLTTTIRPFDNDGRTVFRANYEYGKIDRVRARPWAPFDQFSTWVDAGAPLFDNTADARPGTSPSAANPFALYENNFVDIRGQDAIQTFRTARSGNAYRSYVTSVGPIVNGEEQRFSSITEDFVALNPLDLLLNKFGGDQTQLDAWLNGLGALRSIPDAWAGETLTIPREVFFSGNYDTYTRDYNGVTLFLEQRIGDNLFIEIAGNVEDIDQDSLTVLRATDYGIQYDPNMYLPDGSPNPYAGMPYVAQTAFATDDAVERETSEYRATVSYVLDLTGEESFLKHLGHHNLSALYTTFNDQSRSRQLRPAMTVWDGEPIQNFNNAAGSQGVRWAGAREHARFYLLPGTEPYVPEPMLPLKSDPAVAQADWFNFQADYSEITIDSLAFSTQSYFLKDRLVVTAGWRKDEINRTTSDALFFDDTTADASVGDYFGEVDAEATYANRITEATRSWDNYSYGAVYHVLRQRGPLDYLSVFANKGTNVSGEDLRYDISYDRVSPLSGLGQDMGLKFGLLEGKLSGSITFFETSQTDNYANNNFLEGRGEFFGIHELIRIIDPNNPIVALDDTADQTWVPIFDSTTTGIELEMVWNVTQNLRFRFSYSEQENEVAGFGNDIEAFYNEYRPAFNDFVSANYDPAFTGAVDPNNPTEAEQRKIDAETIQTRVGLMDNELILKKALNGVLTPGIPENEAAITFNYTLPRSGPLKGFSVGGNLRYRGTAPLAYETSADGSINVANAYRAPSHTEVDLRLTYTHRFRKAGVNWRTQIQMKNLFNNRDDILLKGEWDRTTETFRVTRNFMVEPRSLIISSSLSW